MRSILILLSMLFAFNASAGLFNFEPSKASKFMNAKNSFILGETALTQKSQSQFNKQQPAPVLGFSLERQNLINRLKTWNNANKISYIYLLEKGVGVVAYYAIKGKVSSVNSMLTTSKQLLYMSGSREYGVTTVDSPDMDGSYGSNGDAVFFYKTDGSYVEWNGTYLLSDKPMKLNVQPLMTVDMTQKVNGKK